MSNALDYVKKYENEKLTSENFTELDSLVLCELLYSKLSIYKGQLPMNLEEIKEEDLIELTHKSLIESFSRDIVRAAYHTDRYKYIELIDMEKKDNTVESEQFFAATFKLVDGSMVVVYRGTDSTIHGWEESLSMSFDSEIPSQSNAKNYLNRVAKNFDGKIIVCGHSKGGNLAEFAASTCDKSISDNILNVYNLDGPGFFNEFYQRDDYMDLGDKIKKYIPQHSIFGLLLHSNSKTKVIESNAMLISQHMLAYWQVEDNHFKYIKTTDDLSKTATKSISEWLEGKTLEERKDIVKTFISLIEDAGIENSKEASENAIRSLLKIKNQYDKNSEEYANLEIAFNDFYSLYKEEILSLLPQINIFKNKK